MLARSPDESLKDGVIAPPHTPAECVGLPCNPPHCACEPIYKFSANHRFGPGDAFALLIMVLPASAQKRYLSGYPRAAHVAFAHTLLATGKRRMEAGGMSVLPLPRLIEGLTSSVTICACGRRCDTRKACCTLYSQSLPHSTCMSVEACTSMNCGCCGKHGSICEFPMIPLSEGATSLPSGNDAKLRATDVGGPGQEAGTANRHAQRNGAPPSQLVACLRALCRTAPAHCLSLPCAS